MVFTVALAASACQDYATVPTALKAPSAARSNATVPSDVHLDRGQLALSSSIRISDRYSAYVGGRAINPNDYVCDDATPVVNWYVGEVVNFINQEPSLFNLLYVNLLADQIPTYEALLFETTDTPQYFGYNGEYTKILQKTERQVKSFWDIPSSDIQLVGMHGTVLQNVQKTAPTYQVVFGLPAGTANAIAGIVRDGVLSSHVLNGGNHPLFSFNSFAISTDDHSIPDKIVMGDGVMAGYAAIGFGDVAPQAVYAHEFGHHIQYENGYFNDAFATAGSPAEQTRYTELMADAFSAYFLTHKRGGTMNRKRVAEFLQVFFQIGDCAFGDPGHHGTPNQRMAAANFGFDIADQAQKQGHIMSSADFHALFVAKYPTIVAPDAH
jgi:hypothetical protein